MVSSADVTQLDGHMGEARRPENSSPGDQTASELTPVEKPLALRVYPEATANSNRHGLLRNWICASCEQTWII